MSREHHLDALRAAAILLLVPYHGLGFLRRETDPAAWVEPASFYVHTFHMPLFFALSGYLAASAVTRRGTAAVARERLLRLGVPFAVALVTVIPLVNLVAATYAGGPRTTTWADVFDMQPLHLWFLTYLLVLSLIGLGVAAALRGRTRLLRVETAFRRVLAGRLAVPVLAMSCAGILWAAPDWQASRTVGGTFWPEPSLLAYYGVFFAFGWLLSRNRDLLPRVEGGAARRLALGAAAATLGYLLYARRADPAMAPWREPALLLGAGFACWLTLLGLWGAFARLLQAPNPLIRYVADASFWIYLVHLPALVLAENALAATGLPAGFRLLAAVTAALAFALLTCALFVQRTAIGRFLRGGSSQRRRQEPPTPVPVPAST